MKKEFLPTILLLVLVSCTATKNIGFSPKIKLWNLSHLSSKEIIMANELLTYGLEHEALYTLLGDLKPISSLGQPLSFSLAKTNEMKDGDEQVIDTQLDSIAIVLKTLESWNRILDALSNDQLEFVMVPFKQPWDGKRNLQILACRRDLLNQLFIDKAQFFGQWGFTKNSDISTVLTTIEFESRNDRYRGYGYFFGYPDYAVDFFVDASISQEQTGEFVKRDFFHLPVAVGTDGYFTYATPKGYMPNQLDSSIYYRATTALDYYESIKRKYVTSEDQMDALLLISDYWRSKISDQ